MDDEIMMGPQEEQTAPEAEADRGMSLTARQYVKVRRWRWERAAGFLHEMRLKSGADAKKLAADWEPLWDAFWARPVK